MNLPEIKTKAAELLTRFNRLAALKIEREKLHTQIAERAPARHAAVVEAHRAGVEEPSNLKKSVSDDATDAARIIEIESILPLLEKDIFDLTRPLVGPVMNFYIADCQQEIAATEKTTLQLQEKVVEAIAELHRHVGSDAAHVLVPEMLSHYWSIHFDAPPIPENVSYLKFKALMARVPKLTVPDLVDAAMRLEERK